MLARRLRLAGLAVCALATLSAAAPAQASERIVQARPGLFPRFSTGTPDYVMRCKSKQKVRFAVAAPKGVRIAVGDDRAHGGHFDRSFELGSGQGVRITLFRSGRKERVYEARCLPHDFPDWDVERDGRPQARYIVLTPNVFDPVPGYVAVFDAHGVPVWWMRQLPAPFDGTLLPNGHLAWTGWAAHKIASGYFEERTLDGSLVRKIRTVGYYTNQHELQLLPDGTYLIVTYRPRDHVDLRRYGGPDDATVLEGEIQQIDRSGRLRWRWSTYGHVALSETPHRWYHQLFDKQQPLTLPDGRKAWDLKHLNSVEPVGNDRLIISLRHTDAVYELDRSTGEILWKLGGTKTSKSLKIEGDRYAGRDFGGQHDARAHDDGRIVTVFDNGLRRNRAPRALEFKLDLSKRTARLARDLRYDRAPESTCCGSARLLPGGDWVIAWGNTEFVTEQTPSGHVVLSLRFRGGRKSYRADPALPGQLSHSALRQGMDAMHPSRASHR